MQILMDGFASIRGCHRPAHTSWNSPSCRKTPLPVKGIFKFLNSQNIWFEFASMDVVVLTLFSKTKRFFFTFTFLDLQSFVPLIKILRKPIQWR